MKEHMDHLHTKYENNSLKREDLMADPMGQFALWFGEAENAGISLPNAMTLATATPDGTPTARVVLLKGVEKGGFVFYTNYDSPKGQQLAQNPKAALTFYWNDLARQVRIEGNVSKVSAEETEAYFHSRPHGSQLAATVSAQSTILANRAELEVKHKVLEAKYEGGVVPVPAFWGGYRVVPHVIEFWQSGMYRLHDRFRYTLQNGEWVIDRLSP
jgi:pyridoxamine-phosphate oxidase